MDQHVEEVEAKPDGDDQSDDRFTHVAPLKPTQGVSVEAHQRQSGATQRHERDIEHDRLLCAMVLSADRHKSSIGNRAPGCKDLVSFRRASAGAGRALARGRRGTIGSSSDKRSKRASPGGMGKAQARCSDR